jgi:hypothetical protein
MTHDVIFVFVDSRRIRLDYHQSISGIHRVLFGQILLQASVFPLICEAVFEANISAQKLGGNHGSFKLGGN